MGAGAIRHRGLAGGQTGTEQGECDRMDVQWGAAEAGWRGQQMVREAEGEGKRRVDGAEAQVGGKWWQGSCW